MTTPSGILPFERPFLPSIRPSLLEMALLLLALVLLLGIGLLRRGTDTTLPLVPLVAVTGEPISPWPIRCSGQPTRL